ncbi:amidohydrolase family protein [Lutibacter sp. B1]|uniref:amidohydrolase family protein n=1 Tax=Lutibacter sp. B1 TaxID=2725996 RepID=UPI00145785C2|nr:amidohydrolase family protein [Lutibacter sp. B1]NLP58094.1 amidohydrolase family protein [Lutibacter sp. B1]
MKLLKRILKVVFTLVGLLIIFILITFTVDEQRTSYLKIKKNEAANNKSYLIANVNVISMTQDTVLTNKMVYIKEGIIQSINDSIKIQDIEVIDAKGKFLMPGLIDMHVHVWDNYELGLYLSNGVTAIRNVWGMPMHLRLKNEVNNEEILSPLFYTTGPKLTGPEFIGDDNLQLNNPEEAKKKVLSYKNRGYDFLKTYYGLPKNIYDTIIEQAKISDMDIVAHPSQKVPYSYHFKSQIKSIEHAEDIVQQPLNYQLDTLKLNQVINNFHNSPHTSFCPTLIAYYNIYNMLQDDEILSSEPVKFMNPSIKKVDSKGQFERWNTTKKKDSSIIDRIKNQHDFHLLIIKKLNDAKANIICGTDAGIGVTVPGFSIHQELSFYKEAGLSNYEVIKTATVNASKTHKIMSNMGTIEKGKIANLLLLDENPLIELSALQKPNTVFINGRKLNRDILDNFEKKAKNRTNFIASLLRYVENFIVEK